MSSFSPLRCRPSSRFRAILSRRVFGASTRTSGIEALGALQEADPLLCPHCQNEMRIIALIDEAEVIERVLRHLGLWEAGVRVESARDPAEPAEPVIEPPRRFALR